jgi:nitroreductase
MNNMNGLNDLLQALPRRQTNYPVDSLFPDRWSPRAMSGAHITEATLLSLFEAARWAPSSNNNQPWRFIYALRNTEAWPRFLGALMPSNQSWCIQAGALLVMISRNTLVVGNS